MKRRKTPWAQAKVKFVLEKGRKKGAPKMSLNSESFPMKIGKKSRTTPIIKI